MDIFEYLSTCFVTSSMFTFWSADSTFRIVIMLAGVQD